MRMLFRFHLALFFLFCAAQSGGAHELQVEPIIAAIRPQNTFLTVEIKGNGEDVVQAVQVRDAERTSTSMADSVKSRLQAYIAQKFVLKQGGQTLHGTLQSLNYRRPDPLDYQTSKFSAIMRYPRDPKLAQGTFEITNSLFDYLPNARTVVSVGGLQKTVGPGQSIQYDPAAVSTNIWNNVKDFTLMGMEHIFTGPDHMLFIVALLLVSTSFISLTKTLTGFTISHSITLILSALSVVVLPNDLVDIFIALSIIYVGLENIFWKNAARTRFYVAAAFGLIHGFGFSYTLRDTGLPEEGLAWCLLSFNLGVEIAQVMICALAWPILGQLRKKFEREAQYGGMGWPRAMAMGSWAVVAMGGYWLVQRVAGG